MDCVSNFPIRYRKNIKRLCDLLSTDAETAFAMMLMTATLMDLSPEDPSVVDLILMDCRLEVEA